MQKAEQESETEPERLAELSRAFLQIHSSLDAAEVLNAVAAEARSCSEACYAVSVSIDDAGRLDDWAAAGFDADDLQLLESRDGREFIQSLAADGDAGPQEMRPPVRFSSSLIAPVIGDDGRLGWIWLAHQEAGRQFSPEERKGATLLASHAATALVNAKRYRHKQPAKVDVWSLIDKSPVGVVVFDAATAATVFVNREMLRIARSLQAPGDTRHQLRELLKFRRSDGRETALSEVSLA